MSNFKSNEEFPVLIVGGSLVGLSAALFLSWHGIPALLVERHPDTSMHTRAGGFNTRTMELFRQVGLEASIFAEETPPKNLGEMGMHVESLVGKVLKNSEFAAHQQYQENDPFSSPTRRAMIGQDKLEPLLRARASALGSILHFNTEMLSFQQNSEGIIARLRNRETGEERNIQARYLIAADGNRSAIRQQLAINTYGYGNLGHWMSILFHTDLSQALPDRKITLCFVNNEKVEGIIGQAEDHWALIANLHTQEGEHPDTISEEQCRELVRAAIGIPNQPIEIRSSLYWELAARIAERYQDERIFLLGDAAHVMSTMGAFGANTGIADAHNIAWKLALVLKGQAHPKLLTTYQEERQPVADLAVGFSTGLYAYRMPNIENKAAIIESASNILKRIQSSQDETQPSAFSVASGYCYHSLAIMPEQQNDTKYYENKPSARPGSRAPHLWLDASNEQKSILDLYGKHLILLIGSEGILWEQAAIEIKDALKIDIDIISIENEDDFIDIYGITSAGAVLIRPDGFIAWRNPGMEKQPQACLQNVLQHILGN